MGLPREILTSTDYATAVLLPAGSFRYGMDRARVDLVLRLLKTPQDPIFQTEFPRREVDVKECYIDKHPVTNSQYTKFMAETGHKAPAYYNDGIWGRAQHPVVGITFHDALAYAKWARKRLPTEEEWEYAARGTDERLFPWGTDFDAQRCNCRERNIGHTSEVGTFPTGASPFGCQDMAGNVWELTSGSWEGFGKAIRGGCYMNTAGFVRCTCRWGVDHDAPGSTWLGFRCVTDINSARIYGKPIQE